MLFITKVNFFFYTFLKISRDIYENVIPNIDIRHRLNVFFSNVIIILSKKKHT